MQLHIVGGFLGSGKTTAIIGAARSLARQGKQVGVVTNDQGRLLVDTHILQAEHLPAMEVSGGCFCCHFDDLNGRLRDLIDQHHPDVIFAESVGSCADVVATVVRPLLELEIGAVRPNSYTVFVDIRLLHRYLNHMEMPFNEDINYIFGKQIEEAGLLFINKTDLVEEELVKSVMASASAAYPSLNIYTGSTLADADVIEWEEGLMQGGYPPPMKSLDIDYVRYAAGEGALAWVGREYQFSTKPEMMRTLVGDILAAWKNIINAKRWTKGHVKTVITDGVSSAKVSLAQSGEVTSNEELENFVRGELFESPSLELLLNMLVEGDPEAIGEEMDLRIQKVVQQASARCQVVNAFDRKPDYPRPTYRITG